MTLDAAAVGKHAPTIPGPVVLLLLEEQTFAQATTLSVEAATNTVKLGNEVVPGQSQHAHSPACQGKSATDQPYSLRYLGRTVTDQLFFVS